MERVRERQQFPNVFEVTRLNQQVIFPIERLEFKD